MKHEEHSKMAFKRSLENLPGEILQQIATYLPPGSAITLLLVCRSVRRACDHWTVWKRFIERNPNLPNGTAASGGEESWKRYVIADIKAEQSSGRDEDMKWMPQLVALGRRNQSTLQMSM